MPFPFNPAQGRATGPRCQGRPKPWHSAPPASRHLRMPEDGHGSAFVDRRSRVPNTHHVSLRNGQSGSRTPLPVVVLRPPKSHAGSQRSSACYRLLPLNRQAALLGAYRAHLSDAPHAAAANGAATDTAQGGAKRPVELLGADKENPAPAPSPTVSPYTSTSTPPKTRSRDSL